jgi:pimeloyl-ACP methyl ester carboxylesterase
MITTNETTTRPTTARRAKGFRFWVQRIVVVCLVVLIGIGAGGASYQALATAIDARTYPPPGQLVDVGGYRLHLYCVGEGSPTVVLETGGGGFGGMLDWSYVQPVIAPVTRVCTYDRAGYGWSDTGPLPRTSQQVVDELHTLLHNAGIQGPYVLAAWSLGGLFSRLYASQYPDEVAGLVLVDTSHEAQWDEESFRTTTIEYGRSFEICRHVLAPLGLWRLGGVLGLFSHPLTALLPPERAAAARAIFYHTSYCAALSDETNPATLDITAAQVRAAHSSLGDKPLVVLSARTPAAVAGLTPEQLRLWAGWQANLVKLSTNSKQIVIQEASHITIATTYASTVAESIRQVVAALRTHRPLTQN